MEENTTINNSSASKGFNPMIVVVIIVLVALIGAAVMMAGKKSSNNSAKEEMTETTQEPTAVAMKATTTTTPATSEAMTGVQTINMEAGSFYYKPNVITVKKGQKVQIVFKAVSMMHNFNIDELNVHGQTTKSGDTSTFEFTADKVGSFEYYCSIANHRQMGQVGTLTVTE